MRLLAVCLIVLLACPAANAGWINRTCLDAPEHDLREVVKLCAKELFEQKFEFELFKNTTPPESILFDSGSNKGIAMPELQLPDMGIPIDPAMRGECMPVFALSSMLKEEEKKPLAAYPLYSGGDYAAARSSDSDSDLILVFAVVAAGAALALWILAANQR